MNANLAVVDPDLAVARHALEMKEQPIARRPAGRHAERPRQPSHMTVDPVLGITGIVDGIRPIRPGCPRAGLGTAAPVVRVPRGGDFDRDRFPFVLERCGDFRGDAAVPLVSMRNRDGLKTPEAIQADLLPECGFGRFDPALLRREITLENSFRVAGEDAACDSNGSGRQPHPAKGHALHKTPVLPGIRCRAGVTRRSGGAGAASGRLIPRPENGHSIRFSAPAFNAGRQKTPAGTVSPPFRPAPDLTEAPLSALDVSRRSRIMDAEHWNRMFPGCPMGWLWL